MRFPAQERAHQTPEHYCHDLKVTFDGTDYGSERTAHDTAAPHLVIERFDVKNRQRKLCAPMENATYIMLIQS
jgi:hypothetical protein